MMLHRLLFTTPANAPDRASFLWSDDKAKASFDTNLSVALSEFTGGRVENRDLLRLAVLVYLVDRTVPRPSRKWRRDLAIDVPMENPDSWAAVTQDIERMLGFLTGDDWSISLRATTVPASVERASKCPQAGKYMLLSGGADSLSGALLHADPKTTCLVSVSATGQREVLRELKRLWGEKPKHFARQVRRKERAPNGEYFPVEGTSRSRSLLFLAVGLLAASTTGAPLLVPENGFASLNPPMAPERRGAYSTRTTHPWYLAELSRILSTVGGHATLSNPFQHFTKGEMFSDVAARYGAEEASAVLSKSRSCGRWPVRVPAAKGHTHCGICFGCLIRRAAFAAAGIEDRTQYLASPRSPIGAVEGWLTEKRFADVAVAQYAAARLDAELDPPVRDVIAADLIAAGLPSDFGIDTALDLTLRGLREIAQVV